MHNEDRNVAETLSKPDIHKAWMNNYRSDTVDRFVASVMEDAINAAELGQGSAVLDAGCGSGTNTLRLASAGFNVSGIDLSEFALDKAKERVAQAGLTADFFAGDLTKMPFEDGSFDAVFCIGVLMHIPTFQDALGELNRVLKPGGKLVISETNQNSIEQLAYRVYWKTLSSRDLKVERHPYGVEVWSKTTAGPLVARRMNIPWLIRHMQNNGMVLRYKRAGAFTELFNAISHPTLKRFFLGMNQAWFRMRGPAALSTGVITIFEKTG
jgi:ubiquinone/menaquinone biosynthesis C-methylase UbiE